MSEPTVPPDPALIARVQKTEGDVAVRIETTVNMAKQQVPGLSNEQAVLCGLIREIAILQMRLEDLEGEQK